MTVCEATQSSEEQLQVAAYECLVRIMQLYYDNMLLYMEKALFAVSFTKPFRSQIVLIVLETSSHISCL
jgi:hypothetical protein